MNFKRILSFIAFIIPSVCIADQLGVDRALSIELTKAVVEMNSKVPQKLDEYTRLDSVATFRNYLIYNNTMLKYTAKQFDIKILNPLLQEGVINTLCANKDLSSFIDLGVVMVYRYHGKDGEFITELSKDMNTCKKT